MLDATTSETYNGLAYRIIPDNDPMNPRKEYDNVGRMICHHGRYTLGDEHDYRDPMDFLNTLNQSYNQEADDFDNMGEAIENLDKLPIIALPLFLYDHSGITMSCAPFSCPWDSGQVGFIYVPLERARHEWPRNEDEDDAAWRQRVESYLRNEVKVYDQYLTGDVYGYIVYDGSSAVDDDDNDAEELDSCWGFFGEDSAIEAAKEYIDATTQP